MFDFLSKKFSGVFSRITGRGRLTEENVQEALQKVKEALLEADVPHKLIDEFVQKIKNDIIGQKVISSVNPGEQFIKVVHQQLLQFLGSGGTSSTFSFQIPSTIMVMGLQGSGKTTTIAKMAYYVQKQAKKRGKKRKILLASVDFYRPAAIDQLEILAKQVGVDFYRAESTDPVQASREISQYAKSSSYELLFLDTAGRLHVDGQMLQELQKIDSIVRPKQKLLVLDAMTGQESLNVAQSFEQEVQFHASILTKMDSEARGGAAFAFRYVLKKPILFVGVGENVDDLEQFRPERAADRILGMGDILSLVEKAEENIKLEEQESVMESIKRGKLTLEDFAAQMDMVGKLGPLSKIMKYLPGMGGMNVSPEMMEKGEIEMKRFRAIINSMTSKERLYPKVLDKSRKERIAKGAGVMVADIKALLNRFEQSQQFVKLFKRFNR